MDWENLWNKYPFVFIIVGLLAVIGWIMQFLEWSEKNPKWKPFAQFVKWSAIIIGVGGILIVCWVSYSSWPEWLQRIPWYLIMGGFIGYVWDKLSNEYGRIVGLLMGISEKLSRIESKLDRINFKKEVS